MNSKKRKKSWRKFINSMVIAFVVVPVIVGILLFTYRIYNQRIIRNDTKITQPKGIESLEKVTLGGVDQWILVRAEDQSKPIGIAT
jgi:hypothetical protein